jgi:hypothetical protein
MERIRPGDLATLFALVAVLCEPMIRVGDPVTGRRDGPVVIRSRHSMVPFQVLNPQSSLLGSRFFVRSSAAEVQR